MQSASPRRRPLRSKAVAFLLPLTLAASLSLAAAPAQAVEPVAGPQTAGDALFPNVGNGGYDVKHYDISLAWTPGTVVSPTLSDATIEATTTIKATAEYPLSSFSLDFEGLEIDSITVDGNPATWVRDIDAEQIKYKLVVTPSSPVSGDFTTVVKYHGAPSIHTDADDSWEGWVPTTNGSIFMGQPIGSMTGYPNNNTPNDKATYTVSLNIPSSITSSAGTGSAAAISNGELVSIIPTADGTRKTWVWNQTKPMATELVLISIGKYDMVKDFVTLSDGSKIPEYSFYDSDLNTTNKNTALTARGKLQTIIQGLESIYGPYPGKSTGIVIDTVPGGINYALETQDRSFFPSANSANGNTLIHELAHQWFGDNVSPKDWNDIWINEGMATWGPTYYNNAIVGTNPAAVETTYFNTWNNRAASNGSWNIAPAGMTDSATLYEYQTYTRGALFWEALRTRIGDDAFFEFVKEWQSRYGGQSAGRVEFQELAEEISGQDLEDLFQDWIYEAGKPAWPARAELSLAATSEPATTEPSGTASYTITVKNTGKVELAGATVSLDLADVLDNATLAETLPDGLEVTGGVATWTVPTVAVDGSESVTLDVTIAPNAGWSTLNASVSTQTTGLWCTEACSAELTVADGPDVESATPTVSGKAVVDGAVTANAGSWQAGAELAYQWFSNGAPIKEATSSAYTPTAADLGKHLSVAVTGSLTGYGTMTKTSSPTAKVAAATFAKAITVKVTGKLKAGKKLKAKVAGRAARTTITYKWKVGKKTGKKSTFKVSKKYAGKKVSLTVKVSKPGYITVTKKVKTKKIKK
ncbi:M1 family aminopeptidase [Rarobacter incanus]|uniref:Aminopeptidase N n=1 Tax=Rarobacter incanus TaxID=153494 RepID=A0A542SRV9_9MICO|nr:M1 family aminopeptidase [Rarobacter incanus]TQK77308.1 peptidase M1-like protein [Rarobacter incanus]